MALVMGIIFLFSDQRGDTLHLPPLPGIDKLAHAVIYGVLAATTIFVFSNSYKEKRPRVVLVVTTLFCLCYGVSDEFHQYFVPGRKASIFDIVADVCGALLVGLVWAGWQKRRQ